MTSVGALISEAVLVLLKILYHSHRLNCNVKKVMFQVVTELWSVIPPRSVTIRHPDPFPFQPALHHHPVKAI